MAEKLDNTSLMDDFVGKMQEALYFNNKSVIDKKNINILWNLSFMKVEVLILIYKYVQ